MYLSFINFISITPCNTSDSFELTSNDLSGSTQSKNDADSQSSCKSKNEGNGKELIINNNSYVEKKDTSYLALTVHKLTCFDCAQAVDIVIETLKNTEDLSNTGFISQKMD